MRKGHVRASAHGVGRGGAIHAAPCVVGGSHHGQLSMNRSASRYGQLSTPEQSTLRATVSFPQGGPLRVAASFLQGGPLRVGPTYSSGQHALRTPARTQGACVNGSVPSFSRVLEIEASQRGQDEVVICLRQLGH